METILVVEDDKNNLELLTRWLHLQGYQVISAGDGIEGLMLSRTVMPALILLDIAIPKLNGWQFAQRLKQDAQMSSIPIIVLTAYASSEDRQRVLALGCQDYETKPIDFARLAKKITYWLNVSKQPE